jgi:hypothetical protein
MLSIVHTYARHPFVRAVWPKYSPAPQVPCVTRQSLRYNGLTLAAQRSPQREGGGPVDVVMPPPEPGPLAPRFAVGWVLLEATAAASPRI